MPDKYILIFILVVVIVIVDQESTSYVEVSVLLDGGLLRRLLGLLRFF